MKQWKSVLSIALVVLLIGALMGCSPVKEKAMETQSAIETDVQGQTEEKSEPIILESQSEVVLDIQSTSPDAS